MATRRDYEPETTRVSTDTLQSGETLHKFLYNIRHSCSHTVSTLTSYNEEFSIRYFWMSIIDRRYEQSKHVLEEQTNGSFD